MTINFNPITCKKQKENKHNQNQSQCLLNQLKVAFHFSVPSIIRIVWKDISIFHQKAFDSQQWISITQNLEASETTRAPLIDYD